jgi:hypothetical protein
VACWKLADELGELHPVVNRQHLRGLSWIDDTPDPARRRVADRRMRRPVRHDVQGSAHDRDHHLRLVGSAK